MEVEDAVGKAIRALLAPVLAPVQIFDRAPRDQDMPCVTFDRHMVEPDDDLADQLSRHRITLVVWSKTRGPKEVRGIIGKIRRTLHWANLSLDVGACVLCEVEHAEATEDGDGHTYMGTAQVRVITEN